MEMDWLETMSTSERCIEILNETKGIILEKNNCSSTFAEKPWYGIENISVTLGPMEKSLKQISRNYPKFIEDG